MTQFYDQERTDAYDIATRMTVEQIDQAMVTTWNMDDLGLLAMAREMRREQDEFARWEAAGNIANHWSREAIEHRLHPGYREPGLRLDVAQPQLHPETRRLFEDALTVLDNRALDSLEALTHLGERSGTVIGPPQEQLGSDLGL